MSFATPPAGAAWQHQQARTGFEVVQFESSTTGHRIYGCTTAVESGQLWAVEFEVEVDASWTTRRAAIVSRSSEGRRSTVLEADGAGRWWIDGARAEHLDSCLDVDLESSALTNTFPVHRLDLSVGQRATAPAAYVRATSLAVERLEQSYTRQADDTCGPTYLYAAPVFDFTCKLTYDSAGLVLAYPGIAIRAA